MLIRFCFIVLREEIETAMRLLGVNSIAELSPKHVLLPCSQYLNCRGGGLPYVQVNARALEVLIYAGETDSDSVRAKL